MARRRALMGGAAGVGGRRRTGRRTLAAALLAGLPLSAGCAGRPPEPTPPLPRVRVMVYNIHAGRDAAGRGNLAAVAALVRRTGVDLVLLQEVDRGTRRSGGVDQLAELERRTGFHGAFASTLDYQGGEYGIALLSRWPILSDSLIRLPVAPPQERAGGAYEPRGALHARVDAAGGPIDVLNTHLDPSADDRYRLQEVEGLLRAARSVAGADAGARAIIGGDFNAEPGTGTIRRMGAAGWLDAGAACAVVLDPLTYPADRPVRRIDYLFHTAGFACAWSDVLESEASDHRPLVVVLVEPQR